VDRALGPSRATLVRDLRGILVRFAPILGKDATAEAAMSRATLGEEGADIVKYSAASLASTSRMSLGDRTAP